MVAKCQPLEDARIAAVCGTTNKRDIMTHAWPLILFVLLRSAPLCRDMLPLPLVWQLMMRDKHDDDNRLSSLLL